jgi:hypothetical protein
MQRLPKELLQLDAFCARLNPGLVAVMTVLSIMLAAEIAVKLPPLLEAASARAAQAQLDMLPIAP